MISQGEFRSAWKGDLCDPERLTEPEKRGSVRRSATSFSGFGQKWGIISENFRILGVNFTRIPSRKICINFLFAMNKKVKNRPKMHGK